VCINNLTLIVGITGGLGYIGSKLVIELEKKGHFVLINYI